MFRSSPSSASKQTPAASQSTSSNALSTHLLQAGEQWADVVDDGASLKPPTVEQLKNLTAVPVGLLISSSSRGVEDLGRKSGKQARTRNRKLQADHAEKHISLGNDARIPWIPRLRLRHEIKITCNIPDSALATSSTSVPVFGGFSFTASYYEHFNSLAAVFDEYMIMEIEVLLTPAITEVTSVDPGYFLSCIDIDDAVAPSTMNAVAGSETCVDSRLVVSHYHRWQPAFAVATYSGAFTSYSSRRGWVDCASPGVLHYGLKYGLSSATVQQTVALQARMHMAFRSVH